VPETRGLSVGEVGALMNGPSRERRGGAGGASRPYVEVTNTF